jgi:hypothetical protein
MGLSLAGDYDGDKGQLRAKYPLPPIPPRT